MASSKFLSRRRFLRASTASFLYPGFTRAARADAAADAALLQSKMQGDVLVAASPDYETARRTFNFNPRMDRRPSFIARCKNQDDILRALEFGRNKEMQIAVRSGGHDVLGDSVIDDAIVIDLSGLDMIAPDTAGGTVRIGPGVRAGKLTSVLQATGGAVALGCNPQVGVAGLTLGGGIGWLQGTDGATCDNLLGATLITADGRVLTASAEQEPDLFWAIRGGGGNFGIVSELTFRTRNLGPVIGGFLAYPGERLADFLAFYQEMMSKAPNELVVEVMTSAPSRPMIFATFCFTGEAARAEAVLAPWRKFGPPLADGISAKPFTEFSRATPDVAKLMQGPPPDPAFRGMRPDIYWMGASLEALSGDAIRILVEQTKNAPAGWSISLGHYLHGAICDRADGATPMLRPKGSMTYHFDSYWFDRKQAPAYMNWVDGGLAAMKPVSRPATYVNYLGSDDAADVRRAYGAHYARLARIKRRYDPENVFRHNRNIEPG
jgi:FAD/FMN-containing dehydrogenase